MEPLERSVASLDALTCRSRAACATCAWSDRFGGCTLEAQIDVALARVERPRAPALAWRRPAVLAEA